VVTYDGLDPAALAALTGAPHVALHDTVPSTLDLAHRLGEAGVPGGAIVLADEQRSGRGRAGRQWVSPRGAGIWLTVLLRPREAPVGGALAIRAALAVRQALGVAAPAALPQLKWPNDLVRDGRKVGGILCEARWIGDRLGWVGVGIGLNVHGPLPATLEGRACTLADGDPDVRRAEILVEVVPRVSALAHRPAALDGAERAAFLDAVWQPPDDLPIVGLDPDGTLLVRRADGTLDRRRDSR
jgi:BirA family biotin operon repressor/biotin-[acetyl-CoA-carboxylase] ligase